MIEFKCPKCSLLIQATPASVGKFKKCPHCESKIQVPLPRKTSPEPPSLDDIVNSQPSKIEELKDIAQELDEIRYPALLFLSKFFKWYAIFTVCATIFSTVWMIGEGFFTRDPTEGTRKLIAAFGIPFSGLLTAFFLLLISEMIKVFLAIERNTRRE